MKLPGILATIYFSKVQMITKLSCRFASSCTAPAVKLLLFYLVIEWFRILHSHIHTHTHTNTGMHLLAQVRMHEHTHTHTHTNKHRHTCSHAWTHTYTHRHTNMHLFAQAHTHTHTHLHAIKLLSNCYLLCKIAHLTPSGKIILTVMSSMIWSSKTWSTNFIDRA